MTEKILNLKEMVDKLGRGEPFCFAHFNDGEAEAIQSPDNATVSRGSQFVSSDLSYHLLSALTYCDDNYWCGLPCPVCKPVENKEIYNRLPPNHAPLTSAVLLMNHNWSYAVSQLTEALEDRKIWVVAGRDQKWSNSGLNVERKVDVPEEDAWQSYNRIFTAWTGISRGGTVLLSCGPMSRVLAVEWYFRRPDCTFIDVGSCFDPWTKGVRRRYQMIDNKGQNKAPYCSNCNVNGKWNDASGRKHT